MSKIGGSGNNLSINLDRRWELFLIISPLLISSRVIKDTFTDKARLTDRFTRLDSRNIIVLQLKTTA